MVQLSNSQIVQLSNSQIVQLSNSQIVQCKDFWSKKRTSESRNPEWKIAQNSGFVQVVVCLQSVGTMERGAQSYAFTPSLQWNEALVTLS